MAFEKTLLERIDDGDADDGRRLEVDRHRVAQSVVRHLRKMLNVRQGSVITLPDYGLPDFNDIVSQFPDSVNVVRRIIKDSLEKYEPILRRVSVRHLPNEDDPMDFRFEISARLVVDGEETPVSFETVFADGGKAHVRG